MYSNRFKPTDYDDFEDIAPYNLLVDGKWTSLCINRHPLYYKIRNRFDEDYDGKLLWIEINKMKEKIEKLNRDQIEYRSSKWKRESELRSLIIEQTRLCKENNVGNTCVQKLQKHLDECTTGCNEYFVGYECQFKENGRCSHYYEIERVREELAMYDYYDHEDEDELHSLKYSYERALAVKENRLEEYRQNLYDEFD
jgi:hypothetical protein